MPGSFISTGQWRIEAEPIHLVHDRQEAEEGIHLLKRVFRAPWSGLGLERVSMAWRQHGSPVEELSRTPPDQSPIVEEVT